MKKHIDLLWHSLFVGAISAIVVVLCGVFNLKTWIVFFAWANYFLHGCDFKKSLKMFLAFVVGVLFAFFASMLINHLNNTMAQEHTLYISAGVTFIVGTCLIFLEFVDNWGEMVPATFLGTVLYYSSGVDEKNFITQLIIPIVIGILAGLATILGREKINVFLESKN